MQASHNFQSWQALAGKNRLGLPGGAPDAAWWWQREGSNLRPSAYEAPALTTELRCRACSKYIQMPPWVSTGPPPVGTGPNAHGDRGE